MKLPALREIVEERKGKAIETLSASFAENRLPLEEYERLVEYINKIESERELMVVEKIVAEYGAEYGSDDGAPGKRGSSGGKGAASAGRARRREDDSADDYAEGPYFPITLNNLTILSSRTIGGPLRSGAQFVSILGSERIKIRREDLSRQRTKLQVVSLLGDSVIQVEPGIRVTCTAIPLLGNAWIDRKVGKRAEAGALELVISGVALLGSITVKLLPEDEYS